MNQREPAQTINDCATQWVARIDAAPLGEAAQAELDAWIARDERHRGAFFRATVAWQMLDRAIALGSPLPASALASAQSSNDQDDGDVPADMPRVARRRMLWGGAIAASLMVAGTGWQMFAARPDLIETA